MKRPTRKRTTGELIRDQRTRRGLSQRDLAEKCGWASKTMVSHYELNRTTPLVRNLSLIAQALKCKVQDLIP